jgi:hypothetical protein
MSLRTSDYTIYVKLPETGEFLLVHGYTGAIDLVQPNVVEFLASKRDNVMWSCKVKDVFLKK